MTWVVWVIVYLLINHSLSTALRRGEEKYWKVFLRFEEDSFFWSIFTVPIIVFMILFGFWIWLALT